MTVNTRFKPGQGLRRTILAAGISLAWATFATPSAIAADATLLKAEQAVASVRGAALNLGMRSDYNLAVRNSMVSPQGRTIVRANQMLNGHRVWGGSALIHVDGKSSPRIFREGLVTGAAPKGTPKLSQARAVEITLKELNLKGKYAPPKVELVVFPTKYVGGIKTKLDERTGRYQMDRKLSVLAIAPAEDNVWAYEVHAPVKNNVDGLQHMVYVVDANTGSILRKYSALQHLEAPNPPTPRTTDIATKGIGYSQYSGTVTLDTVKHADGTYGLIDTTRGSAYNPFLHDQAVDYDYTAFKDKDGNPPSYIGLQTFTDTHEGFGATFKQSSYWYDGFLSNIWGDFKQFIQFPYGGETTANGQTAAVDAHHGMGVSWDFYKNVFKRNGIDDLGSSVFANVHLTDNGNYYDNASWDSIALGMFFSDGTRNDNPDPATGQVIPGNPNAFNSLTSQDIIGHEMTHGITGYTANLFYDGESGGINEGSSDIFGTLIEAYAKRADGTDDQIPLAGNNWLIGEQIGDTPLRDMVKQSQDGFSTDIWFDGMTNLDVHWTSGPLNRWFYFLSQGASATAGAKDHSAYLPGGMTGIGNDHAGRIWYKALTECMWEFGNYDDARLCGVWAATDLYGANATDVSAVRKAFAAINVGNPSDETPARIRVYAPFVHGYGALNGQGTPNGYFAKMPVVAMGYSVAGSADVTGTDNKAVTWSLGGILGSRMYGGVIGADGRWTPPNQLGFYAMTVSSVVDPLQFATMRAWVVNGDADGDTEFDAMDLGAVALSWGLSGSVSATHSITGDGDTNSMGVMCIVEAFKNAFGGA